MNLYEVVNELVLDTHRSLAAFLPELCLCATIVLLLLVRVFRSGGRLDAFYLAWFGSGLALCLAAPWSHLGAAAGPDSLARIELFTGMLVYDGFTIFMRSILIGFLFLLILFTRLSGIPDPEDGPDMYTLFFGATLGMCLMASANHLLLVFLGVEMSSVPSYVLAGLLRRKRLGSEAALKYSIYGAGAAGVMLYGISLVAGMLHTAHLPTLAIRLADELPGMAAGALMALTLAGLMIAVGLAFKLSAVPFHFWCPDVFEGAPAEVGAFLSVASKAAALALLVRVAIGFGTIPPDDVPLGKRIVQAAAERIDPGYGRGGLYAVGETTHRGAAGGGEPSPGRPSAPGAKAGERKSAAMQRLAAARNFIAKLVALLAAVTCTFGNLAAYAQTNMKRLLAYSTIAHAGYMMMPVSALMVMAGHDAAAARGAVGGLAIYMGIYLFMNLGAFAIVAFLRNALGSEQIADYAGLVRRSPVLVLCLSLILFSLVGLPPLSGFIAKFAVFASLVDGYRVSAAAEQPQAFLLALFGVGGVNTLLSVFYYVRVVKIMTMDEEPDHSRPLRWSALSPQGLYVILVTLPTALLILDWNTLSRWASAAARHLLM